MRPAGPFRKYESSAGGRMGGPVDGANRAAILVPDGPYGHVLRGLTSCSIALHLFSPAGRVPPTSPPGPNMENFHQLFEATEDGERGRAERAILCAAIERFGRRGFGGTSVRQVAGAANVTPPAIAYHFGSKEGLFSRCVDIVTRGLAGILTEAVEQSSGLADMVRRLAVVHLDFPQQHPEAVRLLLAVAYAPEESQPEVDFSGPWEGVLALVSGRFEAAIARGEFTPREGAEPYGLTRHLFNLLHQAVFAECRNGAGPAQVRAGPGPMRVPADPVRDICDQFFAGAGRVASSVPPTLEDAR
jgi:AcrR family transcriptional regulator